jgi:hypothetical protein
MEIESLTDISNKEMISKTLENKEWKKNRALKYSKAIIVGSSRTIIISLGLLLFDL